jgi:ornithine cyclodeaminase
MGADGAGKQELESALFACAQVRAVDSLSQCSKYGDSALALEQGLIQLQDLVELGRVIQDASLRRRSGRDITIADLTGVAVQDMAIAELALQGLQLQ